MIVRQKDIYIFVTIFILTLSNCLAYVGTKIEPLLEYIGYFFLLSGILYSYFKTSIKYREKNTSIVVATLFILLVSGILVQRLTMMRKATLIFSVAAIIIVSVMSEGFLIDSRQFRVMAYACLTGVLVSIIACLIQGVPLTKETSEPTFGIVRFFTGGIRDKNIATMMLAIILSLYIYSKDRNGYKGIDIITSIIAIIMIIASSSRGAWIEVFVFLFMLNYKKISKITKAHRSIVVITLVLVIIPLVVVFFNKFILKSETYLFRYRGLTNYISMFGTDAFHMIFGNAELAYGTGEDYAIAIRSVTGWNGTIEIAWLNILIKNGLLGIVAYIIIFSRAIHTAIKCNCMTDKTIYLAITITMIVTSFVAIYIQTIHGLFGIYCYLIMAYYSGRIRRNRYFKNPTDMLLSAIDA